MRVPAAAGNPVFWGKSAGRSLHAALRHGGQLAAISAGLGVLLPAAAAAQLVTQPEGTGVQVDTARVFGDDQPRATGSQVNAGSGFTISADLVTEWSDNIARQGEDVPLSGQFESRSDWRFRPSVTLSAGRALGRHRVFANMNLGRDFYVRNTILDNNRFLLDGGLEYSVGASCGGRLQGGYEDRGTRFDQFNIVVPSKQKTVNFFVSAGCQSPVGLSPNISYDWSRTTNSVSSDDPLFEFAREISDVDAQGLSGGLTYALAGRGDVGVEGSWRTYTYPNQVFAGVESKTEIFGMSGVVNYRLGPSLQATAGLGYTWASSNLEFGTDFSGPTWQGSLAYTGPRIGVTASLSRSVNGATSGIANYQLETSYQIGATYRAGERIGLNIGYVRSDIDSRGFEDTPGVDLLQQNYELKRFFLGADYRFNRRFSAALDYSHEDRTSQPDIFSYKANTIAFSLRASF